MKTGRTIQELAQEVVRQRNAQRDFFADTQDMKVSVVVEPEARVMRLGFGDHVYNTTVLAREQIAGRLGIPMKYFDRMFADAPDLLEENVNHWFEAEGDRRLIRVLDNRVRAFLSDRYRPLDNAELLNSILPRISSTDYNIESCEITDTKLYLKVLNNRIKGEVVPGDVVQMGFSISNSEVGKGSLRVEPLIYRLVCKNGAIVRDSGIKKFHIGRTAEESETYEYLRDETRKADDRVFFMKVRDMIDKVATKESLDRFVSNMRKAKAIDIKPEKAIEDVTERFKLTEVEQSSVLAHLIRGGELNQYGMINAITATAQEIEDYDRATELEIAGGDLLSAI